MGMASVAILGSLFIPSFYAMIASVSDWLYRKRHPNQDRQEQAELGHDNA
jgi:HAE1 family hydrophobic/amphiphilic exporter-1/multidrug efflux pump